MRKPEDIIGGAFEGLKELPAGVVMFTGTIPAIGEITGADHFAMALVDPRKGRSLRHGYDVAVLPLVAWPARRPSGIGPGADRSSGHLNWSTLP